MRRQRAWLVVFFLVISFAPMVFSQDIFIKPDLVNLQKIREAEKLSANYRFVRVYIFLAVKKAGDEYKAYVTKNTQDLDGDKKSVLDEPNDLAEYELLTTFSNKLEIGGNKHICYITALPHFAVLFPNVPDPFKNNQIIKIPTELLADDPVCLVGSKTLPLLDMVTEVTVGVERYVAFYKKEVTKVELTKEVEENGQKKQVKTGEIKETIGPGVGSYGFIFMQLEESKE